MVTQAEKLMVLHRRAFTMIEAVMVAVILAVLAILLLPAMKQRWNADGQSHSINNVRQLLVATGEYRLDNLDRVPIRATGYSNGQINGGWTAWSFAGKNCDFFWQTSFADEKAYWRFLNPYVQSAMPIIPVGSVNSGSGATWTFIQGTITPQQRAAFQVKVCRSPGDVATRQRAWPNPTAGISGYTDVGTSYHQNMFWWNQPGGPTNFTAKFNAGAEAMRRMPNAQKVATGGEPPVDYVFIHDQIGGVVPSLFSGGIPGEFGGTNMSVVGYLDGRSAYIEMKPNALSGPGYTLGFPWP